MPNLECTFLEQRIKTKRAHRVVFRATLLAPKAAPCGLGALRAFSGSLVSSGVKARVMQVLNAELEAERAKRKPRLEVRLALKTN